MKPWTVMLQFSFTTASRKRGVTVSPIALLLASIVAASCGSSDQTKQVRGQSGGDAGASDADGGKSPAASGGAVSESQAGGGGDGESLLGAAGESTGGASSGGASSGGASSGGAAVGGSATGGTESSGGFAGSWGQGRRRGHRWYWRHQRDGWQRGNRRGTGLRRRQLANRRQQLRHLSA